MANDVARRLELTDRTPEPEEVPRAVGIGEGLQPDRVIRLVHGTGLQHVVQKDSLSYDTELRAGEIMIENPSRFFDHPLDVILGPAPAQSQEPLQSFAMACEASEKKNRVLTAFGDFVANLPGSRAIWDQALLIADELYTNGSKNAWDAGTKLFDGPPVRTGRIEFFAAADGKRLVIGCRDSFGRLAVGTVLARIWTCYENGVAGSIRHGTGGAGIGSYMVFDSCASYYAGVEAGKRSVVCVVLPLGLSRRAATGLSKNIHLLT